MTQGLARAIFLDRDGVINRPVWRAGVLGSPRSWEETEILPGVPSACARLKAAGFGLVVVTNQPDVARGLVSRADVDLIHRELRKRLPIDLIGVCYHDDADGCLCRKPLPGLLLAAANSLGLSLPDSVMVGDRWKDIDAGEAAGCRTVFVDWNYSERRPGNPGCVARSLEEAVGWILQTG